MMLYDVVLKKAQRLLSLHTNMENRLTVQRGGRIHDEDDIRTVARKILSYLIDHPDAEDSLEGVLWWLLEQEIKTQESKARQAIDILIGSGLIVEHRSPGSKVRYRANWRRRATIADAVQERKRESRKTD
jgi:hypothetical protein